MFSATGQWTVFYSYDCGALPSTARSFRLYLYSSAGGGGIDVAGSSVAVKGQSSRVENVTGTFYLSAVSTCSWHVVVKGVG
jgi:hypothetical protein